ncbi:MAG: hypothetical protein ACJ71I_02455 [Nitrososphaeraceae archaeon]
MNALQDPNYNSAYSIIILMVTVFVLMLSSTNVRMYFDQIALAKNATNATSNPVTGKSASESAESLVRSIMDPSSLMSSVINETGGSTKQSSTGLVKNLTTNGNSNTSTTAVHPQALTKNGNITTTSSHPSSTQLSSVDELQHNMTENTVTRNIDTLLLAHQIIPPRDFLHLYDTDPYSIINGHVSAKVPCDANSSSSLQMLVGHLPQLKPLQLDPIKEFSKPGYLCMYEGNISSPETSNATSIDTGRRALNTDLILLNPTDYRIILPNTSSVVISVDQGRP